MISEHKADLRAIKAVFELRTMSECGFLPQLVCCRDCGTYDAGDAFYLDVQEGYLLCADCAAKAGKRCNRIAMHCLHCGTSALWRTKKYFRSRFLWAVWKSWQP